MIRFVQRHRTIAALLYRLGLQGWVSRRVWAELAVQVSPRDAAILLREARRPRKDADGRYLG